MVEKLLPDSFLKNKNWAYLSINSLKFDRVCFYCKPCWGFSKLLKLSCRPLVFTSYRPLLSLVFITYIYIYIKKNKKRSGTSFPASFPAWKKWKNPLPKNFLHFRECNFLAPRLKNFLYFRKWNFLALILRNVFNFLRRKLFLYFGKWNFLKFQE